MHSCASVSWRSLIRISRGSLLCVLVHLFFFFCCFFVLFHLCHPSPYNPADRSPITFHTSAWQNPSDPLPLMTWYTTTALDGGVARVPSSFEPPYLKTSWAAQCTEVCSAIWVLFSWPHMHIE